MAITQQSYLKPTAVWVRDPRAPHPLSTIIVLLMVLSLFGPYLFGGIRTDQVIVYGLAAVVIPLRLPFIHLSGAMRFLFPWALLVFVSLLGVAFPIQGGIPYDPGGVFAGLDNLLVPLAVMLTVLSCVTPSSASTLLRKAGKVYVWAMALNAFVAILDTRYELSAYLRPFWAREGAETTVAMRAEIMGRLSGIINQPSSAGLAYSLAGLLAVYLYSRQSRKLYFVLALITIGGMLTVSKVFILIGAPLILLYLWKSWKGRGKTGMVFTAAVLVAGVIQSGFTEEWKGANYLARLIAPPESQTLIGFYSAGRWAEDSPMLNVLSAVMDVSPLAGIGAGGWDVAYDSVWTEAIVVAGLFGAACIAAVLIGVFRLGKLTLDPARRRFTFFLAWMLLGASFGVPAFTTNRIGAMVWLVLAMLVLAHREVGEDEPEQPVTVRRRARPSTLR